MWLRVMPGVATCDAWCGYECCLVWLRVLPGVGASGLV